MRKIFWVILLVLILVPSLTRAVLVPCGGCNEINESGECISPQPPCQFCHFFVLFDNIIDFLLIPAPVNSGIPLIPVVAILMIAIGGLYFLFSSGNPSTLAQGKAILKYTAIGLLIIYGAWIIVNEILTFPGLVKPDFSGWHPSEWFQIKFDPPCPKVP